MIFSRLILNFWKWEDFGFFFTIKWGKLFVIQSFFKKCGFLTWQVYIASTQNFATAWRRFWDYPRNYLKYLCMSVSLQVGFLKAKLSLKMGLWYLVFNILTETYLFLKTKSEDNLRIIMKTLFNEEKGET